MKASHQLTIRVNMIRNVNTGAVDQQITARLVSRDTNDNIMAEQDMSHFSVHQLIDNLTQQNLQLVDIGSGSWDEFNVKGATISLYFSSSSE